jgi:hypothetical protein
MIMMMLGQNVSPASIPGPIGFGFGSFVRPRDAAAMMASKGPEPSTRRPTPQTNIRESRYLIALSVLAPEHLYQ